jgi:hypothetical protein
LSSLYRKLEEIEGHKPDDEQTTKEARQD